jgi:hypothetical protein
MSSNSEIDTNDITVYIKMLSGEIFPIIIKAYYGLFLLKREIMNYLWNHMKLEVTTNEIVLFDIETYNEIINDCHATFKLKKDGMYLLFIRDPIKYEKMDFIYTARGIDLYRFNYVSKEGYVEQNTFSLRSGKDNHYEYSINFQLSFLSNGECNWYSSLEEMFKNGMNDKMVDESIDNLIHIWKYKHFIDRDTSYMEL